MKNNMQITLKGVIFCMTAPIIPISDSPKFSKYMFFFKYFPRSDFLSKYYTQLVYSI